MKFMDQLLNKLLNKLFNKLSNKLSDININGIWNCFGIKFYE